MKLQTTKSNKPRLFVDMDGTVAKWRNIKIDVDSSEDASAEQFQKKLDDILYTPNYFYSLPPQMNVINAIKLLIEEQRIEVYILSCVKEDKGDISPLNQKQAYIDKYLPEIDRDHRIFVPDGYNKKDYVSAFFDLDNGITLNDYLLDDYTKNLLEWEKYSDISGVGQGIKLLNQINSTKGTWIGPKISYVESAEEIADSLIQIMNKGELILHPEPQKDFTPIKADDFLKTLEIEF